MQCGRPDLGHSRPQGLAEIRTAGTLMAEEATSGAVPLVIGSPRSPHLRWPVQQVHRQTQAAENTGVCVPRPPASSLARHHRSTGCRESLDRPSGAPAPQCLTRGWTRPSTGHSGMLSASLHPSFLLWPGPPGWSPCGGVHLPDPQFPPYSPLNDSSWRMSVSPQNPASTRTSVSRRSLACSECVPAATDIEVTLLPQPREWE